MMLECEENLRKLNGKSLSSNNVIDLEPAKQSEISSSSSYKMTPTPTQFSALKRFEKNQEEVLYNTGNEENEFFVLKSFAES